MFETSKTQQPGAALTAALSDIKKLRWQDSPLWLSAIREEGQRYFNEKGLPAKKNEEWKYTDISPLTKHDFLPPQSNPILKDDQRKSILKFLETPMLALSPFRLVFIDGFYSPVLSQVERLPLHVAFDSLAHTLATQNPLIKKHLATYADYHQNPFVALSNAYIEDGAFIHIPRNTSLQHPLHIIYITQNRQSVAYHPRNLIIAEPGTQASVIEQYVTLEEDHPVYFNNPVSEIVVSQNAQLQHFKIQQESQHAFHIAYMQAEQARDSQFTSHSLSLGGKLTRNNIHSYLFGTNAECNFNGLYIAGQQQHVDNHTLIYHHSPHCQSNQLYHGILDQKARGVFNGKVYVEPEAQQTDSQQTSRALMLSDHARVDAKPQLEIFADDVKCTHGATVGRLDENALYYLRSRGITKQEARKMLTLAFGQQVIDHITHKPLRQAMNAHIAKQIHTHDNHLEENKK